jgi:hypothetical protein
MALQNSGTITMDDIGKEFQGPKPYDLESHRRGAGKVPAQIPGYMNPPTGGNPTRGGTVVPSTIRCDATGPWAAGLCGEGVGPCVGEFGGPTPTNPQPRTWSCGNSSPNPFEVNVITLNMTCFASVGGSKCGERWAGIMSYGSLGPVGATMFGYERQEADTPSPNPPNPNPPGPNPPNPIVPGNMNPPIPINTNVPETGRIAVEDFYGATR